MNYAAINCCYDPVFFEKLLNYPVKMKEVEKQLYKTLEHNSDNLEDCEIFQDEDQENED